ncbi:triacylglycerol lipase [Ancylostoma ceylanicum]|uniref:Triacylglycerol lipase n=1 Tax=Ancylostoma ceylanicum TaxID=53326 RepID=A0A0D6L5Z7_9BILA|nr:triacylglycerol lipase [Ancylostoma ceylanicum]
MARRDIGPDGSFGGGDHQPGSRTSRQAVVIVHGITNTAGRFAHTRQHLLNQGWKESEIYATTYGDGGKTAAPMVDMKCDYVRWLIQAVAEFTRRRVDVIGYSMGSPVARKAILGGKCVDTGERLGPKLTALVDTQRYEGLHVYSIYSPQDDKVGFRNACGELTSAIGGSDQEFQRPGNHDVVMADTVQLQANLIHRHSP